MTSPAAPRKPTYRTFVAERQVGGTRERVWAAVVDLLATGEIGPAAAGIGREDVLSFEPPWRRSARLSFDPSPLAEHTVALRDDGDSCHLVWAYLVEPPTAAPGDAFDRQLEQLAATLRASCERVALAVEQS